jgi:hypothetical protein
MAGAYYSEAVKGEFPGWSKRGAEIPTFRASELLYLQSDRRREKTVSNMVSNRYIYELCSANQKKICHERYDVYKRLEKDPNNPGPTHEAGAEL